MSSKLRLKVGAMEVEYEGTDEFIKSDLRPLLEFLGELNLPEDDRAVTPATPGSGSTHIHHVNDSSLTTSTIAQKLGVSSGPELVVAALARLSLVQRKDSATRKEILTEMKNAKTYFRKSYSANLGSSLGRLVSDGQLNDVGTNTYSLSKTKRDALEKEIAK
jgi:hypothetical protein